MTQGWTVGGDSIITCTKGLPEGARFVGSRYAPELGGAVLEFAHESFPELKDGEPSPLMNVTFEFIRPVNLEFEQ